MSKLIEDKSKYPSEFKYWIFYEDNQGGFSYENCLTKTDAEKQIDELIQEGEIDKDTIRLVKGRELRFKPTGTKIFDKEVNIK